jgi:uncharacterized protein
LSTPFVIVEVENFGIRPSRIDGLGLFALTAIPQRRKLGELTGEVVTAAEGDRRASRTQRIAIVELRSGIAIDATGSDCLFKYVNHSCDPNTYIRCTNTRVEFYSLRIIRADEELTANYGVTQHAGLLRCACRSSNCRGYL